MARRTRLRTEKRIAQLECLTGPDAPFGRGFTSGDRLPTHPQYLGGLLEVLTEVLAPEQIANLVAQLDEPVRVGILGEWSPDQPITTT